MLTTLTLSTVLIHFLDEENEVQIVTPKSYTEDVKEVGFKPGDSALKKASLRMLMQL